MSDFKLFFTRSSSSLFPRYETLIAGLGMPMDVFVLKYVAFWSVNQLGEWIELSLNELLNNKN